VKVMEKKDENGGSGREKGGDSDSYDSDDSSFNGGGGEEEEGTCVNCAQPVDACRGFYFPFSLFFFFVLCCFVT